MNKILLFFLVSLFGFSKANAQCSISANVTNIACNDNDTPIDPSDDVFDFEVNISGNNTGTSWSANDPNNTTGLYTNSPTHFGSYPISGGDLIFTITDVDDHTCTTMMAIVAPNTCSNSCSITASATNVLCDDNDTPIDPSDDTFSFDVIVTGVNTGVSWSANDPNTTSDSYVNSPTHLGPYAISDGDLSILIADVTDNTCTSNINVPAPSTCSSACDATIKVHTGFLTVTASGTPPFTYAWSNGATTDTIDIPSSEICVTVTDANNCISTDCIIISNLQSFDKRPILTISPNPASDQIHVQIHSLNIIDSQITITDISGKVVFTKNKTLEACMKLDISTLPSGAYFINLFTKNTVLTQKMTKF